MAVFLVSYDLNRPGQDYTDLWTQLRAFPHNHAMASGWLLDVNGTGELLFQALVPFIDDNDVLFINPIPSTNFWSGRVRPDTLQWLRARGL
jgi:hypothetical protein